MRTLISMRLLAIAALVAVLAPAAERVIDVAPVWSGHSVGFDLLTHSGRQFVAFYDDQRRMTIAARSLSSDKWQFARLPSQLVWDSHNYVTMAIDDDGYLHVSGNMHVVPLVYFRTAKPLDINTFERVPEMVGRNETRCTYPRFLRGPSKELLYTYRDGKSGNGDQIYNVYDHKTRTWRRLLDQPLTDGQNKMNAYFHGPAKGPDGYFHLVWVWRDTPACETNHDLTYARSKDLIHWETGAGKPVTLPMRLGTADTVDPVPARGGIINGNTMLGFDSKKRPVITYHKFDEKGNTQIYNARLEDGRWKIYQTSKWDYRWEFSGGGTIIFEIRPGAVKPDGKGGLTLDYSHVKYGSGAWRLNEDTFEIVGQGPRNPVRTPSALQQVESKFPGMEVKMQREGGTPYMLRWETLGPNRDRPRQGPLPEPSMLRLIELQ